MPKASNFDDRDVNVIINEQKEKEKTIIRFNRPKLDEILELYHKIDKKYTEIADTEILSLVDVFAKFYVQMDNKEKIEHKGKKVDKTSREYAIEKLNVKIGQLARKDGDGPRSKIIEDLFKREIRNYEADLKSTYEIYRKNVKNGSRTDKKITAEDMRYYLQNYTS